MINVKIFVDQLSESEQIILWSPMAPMFVKIETHKTIKDKLRKYIKLSLKVIKNKKLYVRKTFIQHIICNRLQDYKRHGDQIFIQEKKRKRNNNFSFCSNFNLTR